MSHWHIGLRKLACALRYRLPTTAKVVTGAQPGLVDRLRTSICLNMNSVNTSFFSGDCLRCATSAGLAAAAQSLVRANASLSSSWLHQPFDSPQRCAGCGLRTESAAVKSQAEPSTNSYSCSADSCMCYGSLIRSAVRY